MLGAEADFAAVGAFGQHHAADLLDLKGVLQEIMTVYLQQLLLWCLQLLPLVLPY